MAEWNSVVVAGRAADLPGDGEHTFDLAARCGGGVDEKMNSSRQGVPKSVKS